MSLLWAAVAVGLQGLWTYLCVQAGVNIHERLVLRYDAREDARWRSPLFLPPEK